MENAILRKILILDDDADWRKLLAKRLDKLLHDIEVIEYDPLGQGIPEKDFNWPDYDVLFLDYDLGPGNITGLDILQANADNRLFPATILLTGTGNEDIAVRAFRFGVIDYLRKQWLDDNQITAALNNAFTHQLNKRRFFYTLEEVQQAAREESKKILEDFRIKFNEIRQQEKQRLDIEHKKMEHELQKNRQLLSDIENELKHSEREKQELGTELQKLKKSQQNGNTNARVEKKLERTRQDLDRTQEGIQQIRQEYEQVKAKVERAEWKQDTIAGDQQQLYQEVVNFVEELDEQEMQNADIHQLAQDRLRKSIEMTRNRIARSKESDQKLIEEIATQMHKREDE